AEIGFAGALEDGGDAGAGLRLDLAVGIEEGQAEALGQASPDRRLARAHRADEDEVGSRIHGRDASTACRGLNAPAPASRLASTACSRARKSASPAHSKMVAML